MTFLQRKQEFDEKAFAVIRARAMNTTVDSPKGP